MTTTAELASHLRDFLTGGDGYLLDCFMQEPNHTADLQPYATQLFQINGKYSHESYPIGLASPEAKPELWNMLQELEGGERSGG